MPEDTHRTSANADERQSDSAGVATEISAGEPLSAEANAAFGHWLEEKLSASPDGLSRIAMHSGLPIADISELIEEQSGISFNRDHIQRIATALVEMSVISHAEEAWGAAGLGDSDYVVAPMSVVKAMSGGI